MSYTLARGQHCTLLLNLVGCSSAMARQRTIALCVIALATVLLRVSQRGQVQAQKYGKLVYDEGNVGDEFYSQPNYRWSDAAEDSRLQATAGYEFPDGTISASADATQGSHEGDVSLAGFHMEEQSAPSDTPPAGQSGGSCQLTGNPIDDCWRCDSDWASHRQNFANCAAGFGRSALGGKNGELYVVTSNLDDDPVNPAPGTLRYGVTRTGPLWIIFESSMTIVLKLELVVSSDKTIDGRGVKVDIAGGAGVKIDKVSHVILHNIAIHDIIRTGPGNIRTAPTTVKRRSRTEGDAISVYASSNIWIDHCYLSNAYDGLLDVTKGSDAVTISNCYFTNHDKIMLLGASNKDVMDKNMHVTVAYNKFCPGCVQRMPRVRYGYAHVVNNAYPVGWKLYAIGGSEAPTILSQGNVFNANNGIKQVTYRINDGGPTGAGGAANWNWTSDGDEFQGGSFFSSIAMMWSTDSYSKTVSCSARSASMVPKMTKDAGPLNCKARSPCS